MGGIGHDRAGYDTAASRLHFTNFVVDDNDVGLPLVVVWVHISSLLACFSFTRMDRVVSLFPVCVLNVSFVSLR